MRLQGTTEANASVVLAPLGRTVMADSQGQFAFDDVPLSLGANAFTAIATDAAGNQNQFSQTITRTGVGSPPGITAPTTVTVAEDTDLLLSGVSISDADAGTNALEVSLSVTQGVLSFAQTNGLTFSLGDGTADQTVVFTGTLTDINAALESLTYRAEADFSGNDAIEIAVNDRSSGNGGNGFTDTQTIEIAVTPVNDAPVLTFPGNQAVDDNTDLVISGININDIDVGGGELEVSLSVSNGGLSLSQAAGLTFSSGDGVNDAQMTFTGTLANLNSALMDLVYRSEANFAGTAILSLAVSDQGNTGAGGPLSDTADLEITVSNTNVAPTVDPDKALMVLEDSAGNPLGINAPVDADGDVLTVQVTTVPDSSQGVMQLADGTTVAVDQVLSIPELEGLVFVPAANAVGTAGEFSYTVSDGQGGTATQTITLDISAINDGPGIILPTSATVDEDTDLVVNGIAINDIDVNGGALTVTLSVDNGVLSLGQITDLTFSQGTGTANARMVFSGTEAAINQALGTLTYRGNLNFNGADLLTVSVDDLGQTGAGGPQVTTETLDITVDPVNDLPVADVDKTLTVAEDSAATSLGITAPTDVDGDALTITVDTIPDAALGVVQLAGVAVSLGQQISPADLENLEFTPANHATGPAGEFTYTVSDGPGGTDAQTITFEITAVNDAPELTVPTTPLSVDENTNLTIAGISLADVDAGTGLLEVSLSVDNGVLSLSQTSGLIFSEGDGTDDTLLTFTGTLTDLNQALVDLVYRSEANFSGTATLALTVNDQGNTGAGGPLSESTTLEIAVSPTNVAPAVDPDKTLMVLEDSVGNPLGISAPVDVDGDVLTVQVGTVPNPSQGVVQLADGTTVAVDQVLSIPELEGLVFVPAANAVGTAGEFSYTVSDGQGGTATQTITLDISAVNDGPGIILPADASVDEDTDLVISGIAISDIDVNGGDLIVTLSVDSGVLSLGQTAGLTFSQGTGTGDSSMVFTGTVGVINQALGTLTYRGDLNFNGADLFTVSVDDQGQTGAGGPQVTTETLDITVVAVNDPPVADDDKVITAADDGTVTALNINAPTDVDGDVLTLTVDQLPLAGQGTVQLADGTALTLDQTLSLTELEGLVFQPQAGAAGAAGAFAYTVSDGQGGTDTQTITFTISPVIFLQEGTNFTTTSEQVLTLPSNTSELRFNYSDLVFDTSDPNFINDAFEAALVDANGNSLVHTIGERQDAFLNITEGLAPDLAPGVTLDGQTVTVNLAGLVAGTEATLIFRLVNDDSDITTSVRIGGIEIQDNANLTPVMAAPDAQIFTGTDTIDFSQLEDVSQRSQVEYQQTAFNEQTQILSVEVALRNLGAVGLDGPLVVAVANLSDPSVRVVEADGLMADGLPYFDFTEVVNAGKLDAGSLSNPRTLAFRNPDGVQFTYDLVVLSAFNSSPVIESTPVAENIAGLPYRYDVLATDPNGDALSYELLIAPAGMTIDAAMGAISWDTTIADIANHDITVQVSDGRGGISLQNFTLAVIDSPPNRPPTFISTPVVDAQINQPYQYDANAIDLDQDPLTYQVIRGPQGLTINPDTGLVEWIPPQTLALGDTVIGQISLPGERTEFNFNGDIGQKIFLDTLQSFNGLEISIIGPSGQSIDVQNGLVTLTEAGEYQISVNATGDLTGQYGFSLIDPALIAETPLDTSISGRLSPGSEDDLYRFIGNKGQKIFLDKLSNSGPLSWTLYGSGNQIVAQDAFMDDLEFDLPEDGEYILVLSGQAGFTEIVDYAFEIVTPDETTEQLNFGTNIDFNTITGVISEPGEENFFTFAGTKGQRVYLDRLNTVDDRLITVAYYSPSNQLIRDPYGGSNGNLIPVRSFESGHEEGPLTLTEDGIYRIQIDGAGDHTGVYRFSLRDVSLATQITVDTPYSGTLTPGEASHLYQFDAVAGQRLFIDYQDSGVPGGNDRTKWIVYDSGNRAIASKFTENGLIEVVADKTDTYTLIIEGDLEATPVNYSFEVVAAEITSQSVVFNTPYFNEISSPGEQDIFTFDASQGQRIFFDVIEGSDHRVSLVSPSGQRLLDNTSGASDSAVFDRALNRNDPLQQRRRGPFILPEAGTYQLIYDGFEENTGAYGFQILDVSSASVLAPGLPASETLDSGRSIQFYQFTGSQGDRIFIDRQDSTSTIYTHLYGPNSQEIDRTSQTPARDLELTLPGDGTYYLMLRGESDTPVNYSVELFATQGVPLPIAFNTSVEGEITQLGEQDTFEFEGVLGQRLVLDTLLGNPNINLILRNPSGNIILDQSTDFDSGVFWLPETGTYEIQVDGTGSTTGSYRFALREQTTPLAFGSPANGILAAQTVALYSFEGISGDSLSFDSLSADPGGQWILYGPDNVELINRSLDQDFSQVLSTTGQYFLVLQNNVDAPINFNIQINDETPPSLIPSGLNQTYAGTLDAGVTSDFVVEANAGQLLYIDGQDTTSSFPVGLVSPSGTTLFSDTTQNNSLPIKLAETGSYQLTVNNPSPSADSYNFKVVDIAATASEITFNSPLNLSLAPLETQFYKFTGTPGQKIFLDGLDSTDLGITVQLIDPSGQELAAATTQSNFGIQTLQYSGEYYVLIASSNPQATTANIQLFDVATGAIPLDLSTSVSGDFGTSRQETVLYQFTGTANQRIYLDRIVGGTNDRGQSGNKYAVYTPDGQEIFRENLITDREFILPTDGAYILELSANGDPENNYELQVRAPIGIEQNIDFGTLVNGEIAEPGQRDILTFSGIANQRIIFDALSTATSNQLTARVFSPSGQEVINHNFGNGDDPDAITLNESGVYSVVIDGADEFTSSYQFQLLDFADAAPVALDTNITDSFANSTRETKLYRFTGAKDQRVFFNRESGSNTNRYVLYSPAGDILFTQPLSQDIDYVLPTDGDYVLALIGRGDGSDFNLIGVTPESVLQDYALGSTVQGEISEPGEVDLYTFTGEPGQIIWFDSLLPSQNISATLYAPIETQFFENSRQRWNSSNIGNDFSSNTRPILLDESGSYTLVVSASGDVTEAYEFRFLNFNDAASIQFGESVNSSFGTSGRETEIYQFKGEAGKSLFLQGNPTGNGQYYLYDATGQLLSQGGLGNVDLADVSFQDDADYFLVLSGQGTPNGGYGFQVVASETDVTAYTLGESIQGEIAVAGEQDSYTFTGQVGQRLYLDSLLDANTGIILTLFTPSGQSITWPNNLNQDSRDVLILEESGPYTLTIDADGLTQGQYSFRLLDLTDAAPLTFATPLPADFGPSFRESQIYTFSAAAGERIYLDGTGLIGEGFYTLFNAAGERVAANTFYETRHDIEVELPQTGEYFLVLGGTGTDTSNAQLTVYRNTPEVVDLVLGNTVIADISQPGERDVYTFNGSGGQRLLANVSFLAANLDLKLISPTGETVFEGSQNNLPLTLLATGTYRLEVDGTSSSGGLNNFSLGSYSFSLSNLDDAVSLPIGSPVTDSLDVGSRNRFYQFEGSAGATYRFDLTATQWTDANWVLYDPGNQAIATPDATSPDFEVTLAASGPYILAILGTGNSPLPFEFSVTETLNAIVDPAGFGEVNSGSIDAAGQVDTYSFTANAGTNVLFDSQSNSSTGLQFRLINPDGSIAFENADLQNDRLPSDFPVLQSGDYTLEVYGSGGVSTGTYQFELIELPQDLSVSSFTPLDVGTVVADTLDPGRSAQVLSFQGTLGQRLYFNGIAGDNLNIRLIAPNGTQVFAIDDVESEDFGPLNLNQDGAYHLVLQGNQDGAIPFSFQLLDLALGRSLGFNELISGTLASGLQQNLYQFEGKAGETILFDSQTDSNQPWRLYGPGNQLLQDLPIRSDFEQTLDHDGTYTLVIGGTDANALNYQFQAFSWAELTQRNTLLPGTGETAFNDDGTLGNLAVSLRVEDGQGGVGFQDYQIRLLPDATNRNPVITSTAPTRFDASQPFLRYQIQALDPDNDALAYRSVQVPTGTIVNGDTGEVFWFPEVTPTPGETFDFVIEVDDGRGGVDQQTFTVEVFDDLGTIRGSVFEDLNNNGYQDNALVAGDNPYILFVVDQSGSMSVTLDGTREGSAINLLDPNFDFAQIDDTVLSRKDFQYASLATLADQLISQGRGANTNIGVMVLGSGALADMQPDTPGFQPFTTLTADVDNDGLLDYLEGITTLSFQGGSSNVGQTELITASGIAESLPDASVLNLVFMSDGFISLNLENLDDLQNNPKINTSAFGVGTNANLYTLSQLDSQAIRLTNIAEAENLFSGWDDRYVTEPLLENVTVYLDLNNNNQLDSNEPFQITEITNPSQAGPTFQFTFDNLLPGDYTVRQITPAGYEQTTPGGGFFQHTVAPGLGGSERYLFGNHQVGDPPNQDPIFRSTPPNSSFSVGNTVRYSALAIDPDADLLTYDLPLAPEGMAIDPIMGALVWNPTLDQLGTARVIVRARDGQGGSALQFFEVNITPPNNAPIFTSIPSTAAQPQLDKPFQFRASAIDADGDPITYGLGAGAPAGVDIDPTTGVLSWTPGSNQLGLQEVQITATDDKGALSTQVLDLTVIEPQTNTAPQITSIPRLVTRANTPYEYQLEVEDPDGDPLTFSAISLPPGMTLSETGFLSWLPTSAQIDDFTVSVLVEDGQGGSDTQTYSLRVRNQVDNSAPAITSDPQLLTTVGRTYQYQATALDPDGDFLVWGLTDAPEGMVINPPTGVLSWQPTLQQVGEHTITLQVIDGYGARSEQTFTLEVRGTNTPPQITSSPVTQIGVDQPYRYQIQAVDPEGDRLRYRLGIHPDGMTVNADTGELLWSSQAAQLGVNEVELLVEDAQGSIARQIYSVVVTSDPVNLAPVITSTPGLWADVTSLYEYQLTASDPNGDSLTYSVLNGPAGVTIVGDTLTWQPVQPGEETISVAAIDSFGLSAIQTYTLQVTATNQAPVIRSTPIVTTTAETTYRYDVLSSDPDGEPITYTLNQGPDGLVLDERGRLTWDTQTTDIGTYPIEIIVTDARGAQTIQAFDLSVTADVAAPTINLEVNNPRINIGESVTLQVQATDNVGVEGLTLTVNGEAIALDPQGIGTIQLSTPGNIEAIASAVDAAGNIGTETQIIQVIDPTNTDFPFVDLISFAGGIPLETGITEPTDIIGTVTDIDLDFYTLSIAPVGGGEFVEIARGTNIADGEPIGTLDPTLLQNDSYVLRLAATDVGGRTSSIDALVNIEGDLKLGNFRLSFTDLSVPVNGLPIQVTRTYDSLTANSTDDFGFGWRMEFRDTDLRTSLGTDELLDFIDVPSIGFRDGEKVFITLPGGTREVFTFRPKRLIVSFSEDDPQNFGEVVTDPTQGYATPFFVPFFESEQDSTNTLTVKTQGVSLLKNAEGEYYSPNGYSYNPAAEFIGFGGYYELTTLEGLVYRIDARTGDLDTVTDRNGNTLTFTDSSVVSSTGQQVTFERDAQGRITAVIDPEGGRVTYEYDPLGDLVAVTDREGNTTQFDYKDDRPHFLEEIIDPLGRSGVRTEYDDQGRLTQMIDADGNPVTLIYDPDNSVQQVSDQLGNVTTYEYDERGNVLTEIDPLGGITRRTYDENNNMLTEIDPLGNTMTFTYDQDNNILTETDALGNVTRYTYDRNGNVLTTTDPTGLTITNTYDDRGNLTRIEGQAGGPLNITYDLLGNPTALINGLGTTSFEYDSLGNVTKETDANGTITSYVYSTKGNLTSESTTQTLADGTVQTLVTRYEYDRENRRIRTINADGGVNQTIFDAVGNRVAEIDELGRSTKFIYDERGLMVATIYPDATPGDDSDNPRTQMEYDAKGQVVAEIDELGRVTRMVYDERGLLVATIYPDATPADDSDNPRTRTEYDAAGRVTAEIDERGNRTDFVYDDAGRLIETVLPDDTPNDTTDNPRFTTTYDAAGRRQTQTDALGQITKFIYDELGRPVGQEYEDGSTTSIEFDEAGRVTARIDQAGVTTRYEYDALGRLTAVVDALEQRTEYTYDEQGNLITQRDVNGNTTRYEYDGLGRRLATVLPLGERETYEYDAVGNQIRRVDFNGDTTQYIYDERNRLVFKDLPGTEFDETYSYTDNGLRETVVDNRGTTTYRYDEQDRLIERIDPDGRAIAYSYDLAGNRTSVEIPSGRTNYTFDAQNRLKTVTDPEGGVTTYFYNAVSNLERTEFPNGTVEIREYDSLNRLVYIETSGPSGIIAGFRYTLDSTGNRTAVDEHNGRRVEYSYDPLYRLTQETIFDPGVTDPSRTIEYVYDAVGNRLSRVDSGEGTTIYTYDNNDQLLTSSLDGVITSYSYDNNGNTTSKTTDGQTITYNWNADNRLTSVDTDGDGAIDVVNRYNENGIRVSRIVSGDETHFLIDSNRPYAQVLEEYTSDGIINISYLYGNDLISQNGAGEKLYYHIDGLGSSRALSSEDGVLRASYIYDSFGQIITTSPRDFSNSSYLFAGEQSDFVLELDYLRQRFFNKSTGRFFSRDFFPGFLNKPVSLSKYLYADVNPVNNTDPSGLVTLNRKVATFAIFSSLSFIQVTGGIIRDTFGGGGVADWEVFAISGSFGIPGSIFAGASFIIFEANTKPREGATRGYKGQWSIGLFDVGVGLDAGLAIGEGNFTTPSIFLRNEQWASYAFSGTSLLFDLSIGFGLEGGGFSVGGGVTGGFVGFGAGEFTGTLDGFSINAGISTGISRNIGFREISIK